MTRVLLILLLVTAVSGIAPAQEPADDEKETQSSSEWQYGAFTDMAYPLNFNHAANYLFCSRGTAFRPHRVWLNMAGIYAWKKATEDSRWGVELTAQAGKDDEFFGLSATAPLRRFARSRRRLFSRRRIARWRGWANAKSAPADLRDDIHV